MSALDRYITGNYGEDQFRDTRKPSRAWSSGSKARENGKPIDACRCRSEATRQEWRAGWSDADASIRSGMEEE